MKLDRRSGLIHGREECVEIGCDSPSRRFIHNNGIEQECERERCTEKRYSEMPSVEELQKEAADIQKRYDECQKCRGGAFG